MIPPVSPVFRELTDAASLAVIRELAADVWPKTFRSILAPEQIPYMMNMMYAPEVMEKELASGFRFAVLFLCDMPAGYLSWASYSIPRTAKLHKVYLLPRHQHRGYGRAMLDYAADRCRADGFARLRLNVNKHNANAIAAYLRAGYQTVESVKVDIGGGFFMDDFVMELTL